MTPTLAQPPADSPNTDADARFAEYLADVAAHVDDPQWGEHHRMILNDDPQTQRALFDLVGALTTPPIPTPASVLWTTFALVTLAAVTAVFIVGYVS